MGNINIIDKVVDVSTAKPGIYYFVDTVYNTISKIDFIRSYEETVDTDWDDNVIFTRIKYYNHFFHESHASGSKKEDSMPWNKRCNFLLLSFDDAVEFFVYMHHEWADNKRKQLEKEINDKAEKLDRYLDTCEDDTIRFM